MIITVACCMSSRISFSCTNYFYYFILIKNGKEVVRMGQDVFQTHQRGGGNMAEEWQKKKKKTVGKINNRKMKAHLYLYAKTQGNPKPQQLVYFYEER